MGGTLDFDGAGGENAGIIYGGGLATSLGLGRGGLAVSTLKRARDKVCVWFVS